MLKKLKLFTFILLSTALIASSSFALNVVELTPQYFPNPASSRALSGYSIYVGIVDLDPEIPANQKQISVLQEDGSIIQVAQPIITSAGGVPLYNGSPVTVLVDGAYSLKVEKNGTSVYYVSEVVDFAATENADKITILEGVDSIAELRLFANAEDGDVTTVSGYHSPGDGGGGQFYWNASSTETDDGGSVIKVSTLGTGRWHRLFSGAVNVLWWGAIPNDATPDSEALAGASDWITDHDGGALVVPPGVYLYGDQTLAGQAGLGYSWAPANAIRITDCTKPVEIIGYGAVLKIVDDAKYGSFDPVTGLSTQPTIPDTNPDWVASLGWGILAADNASVQISGIEVDGNISNVEFGGTWGDGQYQIVAYGIGAYRNDITKIDNCYSHHSALDGVITDAVIADERSDSKPVTLTNVRSLYNARQGWSIIGGKGVTAISCDFSHTGRNGYLATSPSAGVDVEAESGLIREVSFINCRFTNNIGAGLVADSGDTAKISAYGCTFIGTSATPLWAGKPFMTFTDCTIVGTLFTTYNAADDPSKATKFYNCKFSDDEAIFGSEIYRSGGLASLDTKNGTLFRDCTFTATGGRIGFFSSIAGFENCLFELKTPASELLNRDFVLSTANLYMRDCTIREDVATLPVDPYYIVTTNVESDNTEIVAENGKLYWNSWSAGAGGYAGERTSVPHLSANVSINRRLRQDSFYGVGRIFYNTTAPAFGTYVRGDIVFSETPSAGGSVGWACVVGGTPGTWKTFGTIAP